MRRSPITKTTMGGTQVRFTLKYESEPCEPGTILARQEQMRMLRTLADSPELQLCGFYPFQKMSVRHTGDCWLIELEAIGPE